MKSYIYVIFLIGILAMNCAARPEYKDAFISAKSLIDDAESNLKDGKVHEAAELIRGIVRLYPGDPRVIAILQQMPPELREEVSGPDYFGFNQPKKKKDEFSFLSRLVWYIPDRLSDLLEIASFNIKLGPQIGASVWITRGFQVTIYAGQTVQLGWSQKGNLGITEESLAEFGIGPAVPISISARRVGTGQKTNIDAGFALHTPTQQLYQDYRDYWGYGSKLGMVILGAEFEWHILEIADFITGIFFFDLLDDDLGATSKIVLSDKEKKELYTVNAAANQYNDIDIVALRSQFPTLKDSSAKPAGPESEITPQKKKK